MTAATALRAPCCDWHATTHGAEEHAGCVDCGKRMPLVQTTFPGRAEPEFVCPRCTLNRRCAWPRFLRVQPVPRRATRQPEETLAVKP